MIAEPMLARDDFESFYTKKLEALKIELKEIIKGDVPYVTSAEYACHHCSGRIKVHAQGQIYCLLCKTPHLWSKELKALVSRILENYPSYEEYKKQWQSRPDYDHSQLTRQEIGQKIRKARSLLGLTQQGLANMIFKKEGSQQTISQKALTDYELGKSQPNKYILEQLEKVLSIQLRLEV